MKRYQRANFLMVAAFLLFLVTFCLSRWSPWQNEAWLSVFYFLAQSCFIGCVADYIAVEALFRRPFHLPVGRLIPKSRKRIIRKLGEVNSTLLSRENMLKKVETFSASRLVFNRLEKEENRKGLERNLAEKAGAWFVSFVKAHKNDAASMARKEGEKKLSAFTAFAKGKILSEMNREEWLDKILEEAEKRTRDEKNREALARFLEDRGDKEEKGFFGSLVYGLGKFFGAIDYDSLADSAMDALGEEIETWKGKDNPFRKTLLSGWDSMVRRFLEEEATERALGDFGRILFASFPVEDKVEEAVDRFMEEWGEGRALHEKLVPQLENALHHAITAAGHDEGFRKRMDRFARDLAVEIISYEHGWLAPAMTEVLENFTDSELNEFVESKVWSELEGIRINGALVGLLAGCAFYVFLMWLWVPFVGKW